MILRIKCDDELLSFILYPVFFIYVKYKIWIMVSECELLQMLLRRSLSLVCRTSCQVTCRPYLTDGATVIGSEPDRFVILFDS